MRTYAEEGLTYSVRAAGKQPGQFVGQTAGSADQPLFVYLEQLVEEGAASRGADEQYSLSWDNAYRLRTSYEHADSISLLRLPPPTDLVPRLSTTGALDDPSFAIAISGWWSPKYGDVQPRRLGATLELGSATMLMSEAAWDLVQRVVVFARTKADLDNAQRYQAVGELRQAALASGARLDDYLTKTDIQTPAQLEIELRRETALGQSVYEIRPRPEYAPEAFLNAFDRFPNVQQRYDLPSPEGELTHIAPNPAVRAALETIKSIPGRRLTQEQAGLLLANPYAIFSEEAAAAIDEEQLVQAREAAALLPEQISFQESESSASLASIELTPESSEVSPEELHVDRLQVQQLLAAAGRSRSNGLPIFAWKGHQIRLDAAAEVHLVALARWLAVTEAAGTRVTKDELLKLSAYSARVVGFDSKVEAVPYVATQSQSWLPDDDIGLITVDLDTGKIRRHPMTPESLARLKDAVAQARAHGAATVQIPDSTETLAVAQAESLISDLESIGLRTGPPQEHRAVSDPKPGQRVGLSILHNIESKQYVETTPDLTRSIEAADAEIPQALRSDVQLLPHQQYGLAWLQALYLNRGQDVAGALLADDMGLGKTLQALALIAWAGERTQYVRPSLVVAPVSLLDNWKLEADKFIDWPSDSILSLYGSELRERRLPESDIDDELRAMGVRKLLCANFAAGFRLVLTTYETLRDYQISIARQPWDIVVCDEAQKIKNPAAFVTQAAKAVRARFKIACTGTPVENSLADLWCLFDFFKPGYLGSLNKFTRDYRKAIEGRTDGHEVQLEDLRERIKPWFLRRLKTEVHQGLPRKIMGASADPDSAALPMSAEQLAAYSKALAEYRAVLVSEDTRAGSSLLTLLHRMRMICAYPLGQTTADSGQISIHDHLRASPKLSWLLSCLDRIRERQEKVIIFTDFRAVQRVIQRAIAHRFGFRPVIINGSTTTSTTSEHSRQKLIDAFQQHPGFNVLILGTTAVGFGVNIQGANHVIHFTRSWNPAKEDQATDRAYRIGQTRDVYVYCPTVTGRGFESFEQRLAERLRQKRDLSDDMLAGTQELSMEDFANM